MSPYRCPVIAVHTIQCALFTRRMTVRMCDAPAKKVLEPRGTNRLRRHQIFGDDNSCSNFLSASIAMLNTGRSRALCSSAIPGSPLRGKTQYKVDQVVCGKRGYGSAYKEQRIINNFGLAHYPLAPQPPHPSALNPASARWVRWARRGAGGANCATAGDRQCPSRARNRV